MQIPGSDFHMDNWGKKKQTVRGRVLIFLHPHDRSRGRYAADQSVSCQQIVIPSDDEALACTHVRKVERGSGHEDSG